MTATVTRRFDTREDDYGSETSTLKGFRVKSSFADSERSFGKKICYVNSATCIQNEGQDSEDDDDYGSDEDVQEDYEVVKKPKQASKIRELDLSPEQVAKRKENFDKWFKEKKEREKHEKRIIKEREESELKAQQEAAEERERRSQIKIMQWMKRKEREAEEKIARESELRKKIEEQKNKPKEFKRAMDFGSWLAKKDEQLTAAKKVKEVQKKELKTYKKVRETSSSQEYEKWSRKASEKPKPVPIGKGLESLKGSSTKIYVNPKSWDDSFD